jgi:site-specific recombinase XerD
LHVTWVQATESYIATALDSPNTRRAYARHLRAAGAFLGVETMEDLSGEGLGEYRAHVLASGLAPSSIAQALTAVRAFLAWAGHLGLHPLSDKVACIVLRGPRGSVVTRYSILSEPEVVRLFQAAETSRDRAILGVLLGAGLRVAEAAHLRLEDVVEDGDGEVSLFVSRGKGRRDRLVPVHAEVVDLVRAYLVETHRFLGDRGALFLPHDRGAASRGAAGLSVRGIARVVETTAAAAGISAKRVSPHALRHTYAVRALRQGGNVVAVSKLLGHASITTTQRYVDHLATSELRAAVAPLPAFRIAEPSDV